MIERVALQRSDPLLREAQRPLHRRLGSRAIPSPIAPDALTHRPAEKLIDRHTQRLPLDVPQRDLDPTDRRHLHNATPHVKVVIQRLPVLLDPPRLLTHQKLPELLHHRRHRPRPRRSLTPSRNPLIRLDLHEHIVPRPKSRPSRNRHRRNRRDLHRVLL